MNVPFFLSSGLPFLTVAITMSPEAAAGSLLRRAPMPLTEMTYRFLAPVLSAQLTTAPTGRPRVILNLAPVVAPAPAHRKKWDRIRNRTDEIQSSVLPHNQSSSSS